MEKRDARITLTTQETTHSTSSMTVVHRKTTILSALRGLTDRTNVPL